MKTESVRFGLHGRGPNESTEFEPDCPCGFCGHEFELKFPDIMSSE